MPNFGKDQLFQLRRPVKCEFYCGRVKFVGVELSITPEIAVILFWLFTPNNCRVKRNGSLYAQLY